MKKYLFIILILCQMVTHAQTKLQTYCDQFNRFNDSVSVGTVKRTAAKQRLQYLLGRIKTETNPENISVLVFPLKGYNYCVIGGFKGNGYIDKGYNYLDGNKHLAHPAHDIFINDKNQDNIDDKTNKPVDVLAVANGVVIACANNWQSKSNMRGGNFIWIYHPQSETLTYYAHNSNVLVKPGDIVKQGDKIAEVGRTGYNAYKKRSPTHLHFSAFHIENGLPVPYNCYNQLVAAKNL